jgi:hypothetical protein
MLSVLAAPLSGGDMAIYDNSGGTAAPLPLAMRTPAAPGWTSEGNRNF